MHDISTTSQQHKGQKTQHDLYSNLNPKKNPTDPKRDPIRNPNPEARPGDRITDATLRKGS